MGNAIPLQSAREPSPEELSDYPPGWGPFWTDKPEGEAAIRYSKSGLASKEQSPALTVIELMTKAVAKHPEKPALIREDPSMVDLVGGKPPAPVDSENWETWTWAQYHADVKRAARAMRSLGFVDHDACTVFGYNSPEWMIGALGAMFAGGKASGVYPSDTPAQFQFKAHHSRSSIVLVESLAHLKLVEGVIGDLPYVKAIVVWSRETFEMEKVGHCSVWTWNEFLARSDRTTEAELEAVAQRVRPGHPCSLIYTSGTTGQPKAVMVTHDNIIFEARVVVTAGIDNLATSSNEQERILSYLPLSHVAGQMVDIMAPMAVTGFLPGYCTVFFARPYDLKLGSLGERLRMVKPTIFLGVPRVWEKIAEKLKAVGAKVTGTKKKIATWAKAKSLEYQENKQLGGSGKKPTSYILAQKIVLSKIKVALGLEKLKFGFSGAAPMTTELLEYFASIGFNVKEVYGMSESTGATTWTTDEATVWGTVGFALPGMEVKIFSREGRKEAPRAPADLKNIPEACQGEICFRGRHVMLGYMANPELGEAHVEEIRAKNTEAIDSEGWLHSGDMGVKTETGMVKITGRFKELIIGAGGENIAPVPIEDDVKKQAKGVVANIQMIGDKRKYNIALLTLSCVGATGEKPGTNELEENVQAQFPGCKTIQDAEKSKELIAFLEQAVKKVNANGDVVPSNAAKIQKFTILPADFSVETDELTATLKLKRGVVEAKHAKTIEAMYAAEGGGAFFQYVG